MHHIFRLKTWINALLILLLLIATNGSVFADTVKNGAVGYQSFTDAYAAAHTGDTLQMRGIFFDEGMLLNRNTSIVVNGGFDPAFSSNSGGKTTIKGPLIIGPDSSVILEKIVIAGLQSAASITQYGITWTFDRAYPVGQFANGDYWVVGPVTITGFTPASVDDGTGRIINGSMLNPTYSTAIIDGLVNQGFDGASPTILPYIPALNVAFGVSPSTPLVVNTSNSLVSSISLTAAEIAYNRVYYSNVTALKTASILTVLASPPPTGSFRPPYSGTDKTIQHNVSELTPNLYRLKSLTPASGVPALAAVEAYFERPWLDYVAGWTTRLIKPFYNLPDYGREISNNVGLGALMLHCNFTIGQKMTLLTRFVQVGLDLYGVQVFGGSGVNRNWYPAGGQNGGRKWPILFAGIMLDDSNMKNIGQKSGDYLYSNGYGPGAGNNPPDFINFQEDDQTFYITATEVARHHDRDYDASYRPGYVYPLAGVDYTNDDLGLAEWGILHSDTPAQDNKDWDAEYRYCCTNISMAGIVLAARIMEADSQSKTLWNHPALFDYHDRYMAVTAAAGTTPAWRSSVAGMNAIWASQPGWRSWDTFTTNMWDEYRDNY